MMIIGRKKEPVDHSLPNKTTEKKVMIAIAMSGRKTIPN